MAKCHDCGKEIIGLGGFECSYCRKIFCPEHRLPESHACEMDSKKKSAKVKTRRLDQKPNRGRGVLRRLFRF